MDLSDRAQDILIKAFEAKIDKLEDENHRLHASSHATFVWFRGPGRASLRQFIEFVYGPFAEGYEDYGVFAKDIVEAFDDESMELASIECCKKDFKPWKK